MDICNLALSYLGDSAAVVSISPPDGSVQAAHCARFYPIAVALMLEAHEWNFITKRVTLALLTTCYTPQWQFAYQLPSDANSILTVIPTNCYGPFVDWNYWYRPYAFEIDERERWRDFQIERDSKDRQVILSNVCDAVARYTTSQVTPGMFPAQFTVALAHQLASMLAGPLLKGDVGAAKSESELKLSAMFLAKATAQDANQRHGAPRPAPVWLRDR